MLSNFNYIDLVHVGGVVGSVDLNVEVREQLSGVGSLLTPCGSWGSNSGNQV